MVEGQIVKGTVKSISQKHFWVDLPCKFQGVVFISEVSDFFVQDITKYVSLGEIISLKILTVNIESKKVTLSFKALRPHLLKTPLEYPLKPTRNGFKNLLNHAEEEIKQWKK